MMAEAKGVEDPVSSDSQKSEDSASSNTGPIQELREYGKLDSLLKQIPKKAQHGLLKSCDLILTCVDANLLYIALGTNVGLTFLYNRKDETMQRFKAMSANEVVTSVRLHEGLDHQLATGTASGEITVFFIPGVVSVQKRQVQKFNVQGVHRHYITCLEWSKNGMKLFSGDKNGEVVETVVDFYEGQCASKTLLVESKTEITQLDYDHKNLLVSTRLRSFVVRLDKNCEISVIGTSDRKMPGPFGACFIPGLCKVEDAKLYAARPGCRLWFADIHGVVKSTQIFSDPLSPVIKEIPLLNAGKLQLSPTDFQFGRMKWFNQKQLVTWSNSALVVLDPENNKVLAHQSRLSGIVDVAVTEKAEIFLLRRHAESRVVRVAYRPEVQLSKDHITANSTAQDTKPSSQEAKAEESESGAAKNFFLKKFSNPLKTLDTLINDKKEPKQSLPLQETTSVEPISSPDLPPIIKLTTPELEGVRVYTGGTDTESDTLVNKSSTAPSINQSDTSLDASSSSPAPLGSGEGTKSTQKGYDKLKPYAYEPDQDGNDVVFTRRSTKHKKKKLKSGKKLKDEDTFSQLSASSQYSDDSSGSSSTVGSARTAAGVSSKVSQLPLAGTLTQSSAKEIPHSENTKTVSSSNHPVSKEFVSSSEGDNSAIEALQRADDMLKLVDGILKGQGESTAEDKPDTSATGPVVDPEMGSSSSNRTDMDDVDGIQPVAVSGLVDKEAGSIHTAQELTEKADVLASARHVEQDVSGATESGKSFSEVDGLVNSDKEEPEAVVDTSDAGISNTVSVLQKQDIGPKRELNNKDSSDKNDSDVAQLRTNTNSTSDNLVTDFKGRTNPEGFSIIAKDSMEDGEVQSTPLSSENPTIPAFSQMREKSRERSLVRGHSLEIVKSALDALDSLKAASSDSETSDSTKTQEPVKPPVEPPTPQPRDPRGFGESGLYEDIYGSISAVEATDPFRKGVKKDPSADDFYSKFQDTSPDSPEYSAQTDPKRSSKSSQSSEMESRNEMKDISEARVANSWSEFSTPGNIYSLALSQSHVWFTDRSENIYYSHLSSPKGILWRKATGTANQIAVSPSGFIVWRLHRGVVFAGTRVNSRHPEGLKWVEAVREVDFIAVGNNCAWYIKHTGELMMQRSLSQDRPCYKSVRVDCEDHKIKFIHCSHGVVWAITEGLRLLVRTGVSGDIPQGTDWVLDIREKPPYLFSCVAVDNEGIGWGIDVLGQIWFCDGVSREQPLGNGMWWQVPMSEYIVQEETTMDTIRSLASKFDPKKLSSILGTHRGGLITAGAQGVWLALDFKNVLQVCRGSIQGYQWLNAHPAQMSASSTWKIVSANISHIDWGLTWLQHTNKEIYASTGPGAAATLIPQSCDFCCICAGPKAVWALTPEGEIKVREGMGPHCPQGHGWVDLDLTQLGDSHIVHISCNSMYVWAVECEGLVYQRIGTDAPSPNKLNPVWLPIDTYADIVFTRVYAGPLDWMVWAIDNRRLTYVRAGITEKLPIGQEWVHVPGIQAMDLALTNSGVWALTPNGEVFFRYGITLERPAGNYWKKIPGTFIRISASAKDDLWGIDLDGHLRYCNVRYLLRHQDSSDPLLQRQVSVASAGSDDMDWEFV